METTWNAGDGFEALIAKINKCIIFADIASHPIDPTKVVDVVIGVTM